MAMGKRRRETQESLFIATDRLPKSAGHPFYEAQRSAGRGRLRSLDRGVAASTTRPRARPVASIPPGVYFRMILVGYFEGIDLQRGIAWRCGDSLGLREFLGCRSRSRPRPFDPATRASGCRWRCTRRSSCSSCDRGQEEAVGRQDRGRGLHDAGGRRGHEEHRPQGHGRGLEGYLMRLMREEGLIEDDGPDRRRAAALRQIPDGQEGLQRRMESRTDPDSRIAKMKDGRRTWRTRPSTSSTSRTSWCWPRRSTRPIGTMPTRWSTA